MNELQVKTLKFEPATVEFNYDELAAILEENLQKYQGLTFTEKDAAACKKTIAELRKGKKAVDAYRKETKKKLTQSVTDFENQCKDLNKKFDEVLSPLVEQHDQFEHDRKERKRKQVQEVIDQLLEEQGLNEKYAAELVVENEHLTKSKTLKSIKEELTSKAESLGVQQDKDEANAEVIKGHVELMNDRYKTDITASAYISLLDYKDIKDIKTQILDDAQDKVQETLDKEKKREESTPVTVAEPDPADEETWVEVYEVTGTESQLDAVEEFFEREGLQWKVIEE